MKLQTIIIGLVMGLVIGGIVGYGVPSPELSSLKNQIDTLQTGYTQISDQLGDVQAEVDTIPNLERQIVTLNGEKTRLQDDVSDLEAELDDKRSEITDLISQVTESGSQIPELESEISSKNVEISGLNVEISDLNSEISELSNEIIELQGLVPPYQSGSWNRVKRFSSSGEVTTSLFNLPYSQARIVWSFNEERAEQYLIIRLEHPDYSSRVWSSGFLETPSGETYMYGISQDNYYLEIDPSLGVTNWTVTIEVWVPE